VGQFEEKEGEGKEVKAGSGRKEKGEKGFSCNVRKTWTNGRPKRKGEKKREKKLAPKKYCLVLGKERKRSRRRTRLKKGPSSSGKGAGNRGKEKRGNGLHSCKKNRKKKEKNGKGWRENRSLPGRK